MNLLDLFGRGRGGGYGMVWYGIAWYGVVPLFKHVHGEDSSGFYKLKRYIIICMSM